MKDLLFRVQLENARKRVFISGIGLAVLSTLYFIGFRDVGYQSVGPLIFISFFGFNLVNALLRILLGLVQRRIEAKIFLQLFYILISLGSFSWALSGIYLLMFIQSGASLPEQFADLVKIQFFMIIGILNAIPQFFRHSKTYFIINIIGLYIGLISLVPVYFESAYSSVFAGLIILLFSIVVTPQYLANWKAEALRIEQEQELQAIIDGFPGAVSEIEKGQYKRVNRFVREKIFGIESPDLKWQGRPLGFLHGDNEWVQQVKVFSESGKAYQITEHQIPTVTGLRYFLSALSRLKKDTVLIASVDIDDLTTARQEAENQKHQAQEKSRLASLGLMAAGIAHEINNPLAVIQSRSEMIRRRLSKLESPEALEAMESLNKIFPMVKRVTQIIHSMRSLTRDSSQDDFEMVTVHMILDDITILIQEKLKMMNVDLQIQGNALNLLFLAKRGELAQVFTNAINNSVQAVEALDTRWVRISADQIEGNVLKIQIQDSGLGIPKTDRDKIMTPLFTTKGPGEGTGLGLALSRKIMQTHEGDLYFDHNQKHTTLVLTLPIKTFSVK